MFNAYEFIIFKVTVWVSVALIVAKSDFGGG